MLHVCCDVVAGKQIWSATFFYFGGKVHYRCCNCCSQPGNLGQTGQQEMRLDKKRENA